MTKQDVFKEEQIKLTNIFANVDENKRLLVEGMIDEAAFIKSESWALKQMLTKTGMVKVHPQYSDIQKPLATASQYIKQCNTYSILIKALNSILAKNEIEQDDAFDDFMKDDV
jgi:hypothetical protein